MPTKADLETQVENNAQEIRRLQRALAQAHIDLPEIQRKKLDNTTPHWIPAVETALSRSEAEWHRVVIEPDARIDDYIRTRDGLGWSWAEQYKKNGQFAWCGAFAAYCWSAVRFDIRQKIFPSCYRLYSRWGKTERCIEPHLMLPGDIVVISTVNGASWGDHITLCTSAPTADGTFETVEGNARGILGDGDTGEGVIKLTREMERVMYVYRVLEGDLA